MSRPVGFLAALLMLLAAVHAAPPDEPRVLTPDQFDDSVLYGRTKPGEARVYLISMLDQELRDVRRIYSLNDAQVAAICKGGERDINQWFETVAKARAKYTKDPLTPEQYSQARAEITKLRMALQTDLFGPTSVYRGAVNKTLTGDQRERQAMQEQERMRAVIAQREAEIKVRDVQIFLQARERALNINGPNGEQMISISDEQFTQMLFGGGSAQQTRQQLGNELDRVLQEFDRRYALTDAQKKKLRLAGRGDINDWFDRVDQVRTATTSAPLPQDRFQKVLRELQVLSHLRGDLFGEPSFIHKILTNTLTAEQSQRGVPAEPPRRAQPMPGF